ncbi:MULTISPECIES: NAD(P)-dependent oxidoreductase [Micrococcaceae]|uniref:NAD-dependent epimerase/dehydratase family protein n=1 Tax=Micrococcaceae TaxID=1268 RepID=UPI002111137D|nr:MULTISPECIES: NAD(P)-dependent oxidoreductase [Micrococcaceae]
MCHEALSNEESLTNRFAKHRIKVLVIGSTGFIGSRVMTELDSCDNVEVSIMTRRRYSVPNHPRIKVLLGDVTDLTSLNLAIRDFEVVVNAASYVGDDPLRAQQVNHLGAENVAHAWKSSGARKLIHISTTAVYGTGPHRSHPANPTVYKPDSVVSQTRAAGEASILNLGGIVIRPNLIYGPGDQWFIPGIIRLFRTLGTQIDNGAAKISVVDVADLGRLVSALATSPAPLDGAFHAANPTPTTLARLAYTIRREVSPLQIEGTTTLDEAVRILEPAGFRPHQVKMVGMDHHYESQNLWDLAELGKTSPTISREAVDWYRLVAKI